MRRTNRLLCVGLGLVCLSMTACHRKPKPVKPAPSLLPPGVILIVPPRDVIQKGEPHPAGAGSGAYLSDRLRAEFAKKGFATTTTSDPQFSALTVASEDAVLGEARRVGAPYALQVVLGEFRNAAPMTFRTDFVTLQEAHFWETSTGKLLWSTNLPTFYQTNNLGSHERMLNVVGEVLVANIAGIVAPGGTTTPAVSNTPAPPTAPPSEARSTAQPSVTPTAETRLRELVKLKDQGLISAKDFERKKAEILDGL